MRVPRLLAGTAAALAALGASTPGETVERARYLMGSSCRIVASHPEPGVAGRLIEEAFAEIDRWNGILSDWTDESELAGLNAEAHRAPVACSEDLYAWLASSLAVAEETGGAFDPTVGSLVDLYEIRSGGRWPAEAEIRSARRRTGYPLVALDAERRTARFRTRGVRLDPGGNGKGVALDAAGRILRRGGVSWALLDFGGQVLAVGAGPGGEGFEVELPGAGDEAGPRAIRLRDASAATTSNRERGLVVDGRPLGHILDPRTARPVTAAGSLTVVAATAARADALSTALFVMGPERAAEAAARLGVEYRYVTGSPSHRRTTASPGFRRFLRETAGTAHPGPAPR